MPEEIKQQSGAPFEIVTNSKSKKLSGKNLVIILSAVLFLIVSVFLGVYLVGKRTNIAQKASPATSMYITPGSQTKAPGSNFVFTVNMDTAENLVTGVEVRLVYDPSVIEVSSIQQGVDVTDLSQVLINTYDNTAGTITYTAFNLDTSKAVTGSNLEVLKINAKVKSTASTGNSNITFDPNTGASGLLEGQDVLISKSQGVLVVSGSTSTSPTPTSSSLVAPSKPTITVSCSTGSPVATISWTGTPSSVFGFYADISDVVTFSSFYNKNIASGLSTNSSGFRLSLGQGVDNSNAALLTLVSGRQYYSRIYNGQTSDVTTWTATCTTATATASPMATNHATPTASPKSTSLATATASPSATDSGNSCGGTCGSNSNCKSNYMCYQGYCRNPNCPNESSCGCASATSTAAATSSSSNSNTQSSPLPIPVTGTDWPTMFGIGVGLFTIIASIFLAL